MFVLFQWLHISFAHWVIAIVIVSNQDWDPHLGDQVVHLSSQPLRSRPGSCQQMESTTRKATRQHLSDEQISKKILCINSAKNTFYGQWNFGHFDAKGNVQLKLESFSVFTLKKILSYCLWQPLLGHWLLEKSKLSTFADGCSTKAGKLITRDLLGCNRVFSMHLQVCLLETYYEAISTGQASYAINEGKGSFGLRVQKTIYSKWLSNARMKKS